MTPAEQLAATKPPKASKHVFGTLRCTMRELRLELGLTLRDVELGSGVSEASICRIERGQDAMLSAARKLAAFYGKTIEELWPA